MWVRKMPEPTLIKEFKLFLKTFQSEPTILEVENQEIISRLRRIYRQHGSLVNVADAFDEPYSYSMAEKAAQQ